MTALFHALIHLARLRWLGAAVCALAMLCVTTHASALAGATAHAPIDTNASADITTTASASEAAQTKDRVWGFEKNSLLHVWSLRSASAETHRGISPTLPETASGPSYAARGGLEAEIDAAFVSGRVRSGTMVQFSDAGGPLAGSGPKQGTGSIWFHDNVKIPGAGPGGAGVELRTHAPNPNAPLGSFSQSNYTTQINTSNGRYLLPDGNWKTIPSMTDIERAAAHYPAGN